MDGRVRALVAATLVALTLGGCDPISLREQNESAGFNGGFEVVEEVRGIDGVARGLPANWYFHAAPILDGDATISLDTGDAPEGRQALRLDAQEADSVPGARTTGLFQVVPAEPLRTYRVSFWVKFERARAVVVVRSENASAATPGRVQFIDDSFSEPGVWRRFEYIYGVPEGFENIRFELNVIRPGTVWLDDVRIEEVET